MVPTVGAESSRTNCAFCRIVEGKESDAVEVYRDSNVVAFLPLEPATLGHTLLVPCDHVETILDLNDRLATTLALAVTRLARALAGTLAPAGLNVIQSNGAVATQTIRHLHVHVVPRWPGDAMPDLWPNRSSTSPVVGASALDSLRRAMDDLSSDQQA